ncbi:MAG TPA: hypothetical protein DDW23_06965, partial [Planctomycetes bacterium]|nr:hypothetical protein [Planctomycetota bacterium]
SLLTEAVDYLETSNQTTDSAKWPNIQTEARIRLELSQPKPAAELFRALLDEFSEDPTFDASSKFYARIDLVDAHLLLQQPAAVTEVMDALLAERPKNLRVKEAAVKIKAGYLIVQDGQEVEIPGEGTPEAFKQSLTLIGELLQLAELAAEKEGINKYSHGAYWEAKFQQAYILYRWSKIDSTHKDKHRKLIDSLERLAPDLGKEAAGDDIQRMFLWLKAK